MAINLQVTLSLEDRLSSQILRANRNIQQTESQVNNLDRRLSRTRSTLNNVSNSISNFGSRGSGAILGVNKQLLGLLSTIGATKLAMDGLTSIIQKSAEFEQSQVTISAVFDNAEASKAYTEMVKKVAVESPILDSSAMFSNSLPFLTLSKDVGQLEKAWKVAEKLSIINPMQGVEGSVIAMKELASGDVVSLAERFNISKKDLNNLKDLSFEKQVAGLEKLISGMGITDKAVEEMGSTTAAQFTKLKEKWDNMLVTMGSQSNSQIGKALTDINNMLDAGKFDSLFTTVENGLGKLATKIANFVATADWDAISQSVIDTFNSINNAIKWAVAHWDQIKEAIKWATIAFLGFKAVTILISIITSIISVVQFLINVFKIAKTVFMALRLSMLMFPGAWIIGAIMLVVGVFVLLWEKCEWFREFWKSAWDFAVESAEWAVNNIIDGINWLIEIINSIPGIEIGTVGGVDFNGDGKTKGANKTTKSATKKKSHSGGLSRVPYDGYAANLHRGERVLTKVEADHYENGRAGGNSVSISFAGANFSVRSDNDVEAIASILATKINQAIGKGA